MGKHAAEVLGLRPDLQGLRRVSPPGAASEPPTPSRTTRGGFYPLETRTRDDIVLFCSQPIVLSMATDVHFPVGMVRVPSPEGASSRDAHSGHAGAEPAVADGEMSPRTRISGRRPIGSSRMPRAANSSVAGARSGGDAVPARRLASLRPDPVRRDAQLCRYRQGHIGRPTAYRAVAQRFPGIRGGSWCRAIAWWVGWDRRLCRRLREEGVVAGA